MFDRKEIEKAYSAGNIIIFDDDKNNAVAQIANIKIPLLYDGDTNKLDDNDLITVLWESFMEFSENHQSETDKLFAIQRELQDVHVWYPRSQHIKKTDTEKAIDLLMNTGLSRQKAKAIIQEIGYTLFATEVFPKTHKRTPNIEKMLNIGPKQYPSDLIELLENIYNSFTFPDYTCDFYVYKAINNDTVLYYIYPTNKDRTFKASKRLFPGLEEIFKMAEKFKFNIICLNKSSEIIPNLPIYN